MINYPIIFKRDFFNDFITDKSATDGTPNKTKKSEEIALEALHSLPPLLSLYKPIRSPLTFNFSCLRAATNAYQTLDYALKNDFKEGAYHLLLTGLATSSAALTFFKPILSNLFSVLGDFISHSRGCIEDFKKGELSSALKMIGMLFLDLFFLASFCIGMIEITIACMALQIILESLNAADQFKGGHYFAGISQSLLAAGHIQQAIPQFKVLRWAKEIDGAFTAELMHNSKGFVYLDIPDEYVKSLFHLFEEAGAELPPYFGPGKAGAHVSVMMKDETLSKAGLKIEEIGKMLNFRIVHMDHLNPEGWKEVDHVWFLTVDCPQLEALRTKYGLSPKIEDHDFHLTFAVKYASNN